MSTTSPLPSIHNAWRRRSARRHPAQDAGGDTSQPCNVERKDRHPANCAEDGCPPRKRPSGRLEQPGSRPIPAVKSNPRAGLAEGSDTRKGSRMGTCPTGNLAGNVLHWTSSPCRRSPPMTARGSRPTLRGSRRFAHVGDAAAWLVRLCFNRTGMPSAKWPRSLAADVAMAFRYPERTRHRESPAFTGPAVHGDARPWRRQATSISEVCHQ